MTRSQIFFPVESSVSLSDMQPRRVQNVYPVDHQNRKFRANKIFCLRLLWRKLF
jgi:hypothetical protein